MLQINDTDQFYTPRNNGCTTVIGRFPFFLRTERFAAASARDWGGDVYSLDWREQLIRRAFSRRNRCRFAHLLGSTMLPFSPLFENAN